MSRAPTPQTGKGTGAFRRSQAPEPGGSADARTLVCTTCKTPVTVHEQPRQFIDPQLYICGQCLTSAQPTLEPRQETRTYDPAIADIGF